MTASTSLACAAVDFLYFSFFIGHLILCQQETGRRYTPSDGCYQETGIVDSASTFFFFVYVTTLWMHEFRVVSIIQTKTVLTVRIQTRHQNF